MEEAERFNDFYRAARACSEINAVTGQLAATIGLGGRNRRASSNTERARSAVTKRIKKAINRIAEVIPPLGRQNQDGILLFLQAAPGSPRGLEVLIFSHYRLL